MATYLNKTIYTVSVTLKDGTTHHGFEFDDEHNMLLFVHGCYFMKNYQSHEVKEIEKK